MIKNMQLPTICKACERELINAVNQNNDSAMIWCEHTGVFAQVIAPGGVFIRATQEGPFDEAGLKARFAHIAHYFQIIRQHDTHATKN